ncbi:MAG: potassium channel family protein [Candidatus Hydrothermarchaeales archaeon]
MIIGVGRLGGDVARQLRKDGHEIIAFDEDKEACEELANESDVLVINADGADVEKLEDTGIEKVDVVMATTGSDEVNLMVCEISKNKNVPRIITRVNHDRNKPLFTQLGVHVISPLGIAANFFRNVVSRDVRTIAVLDGNIELMSHIIEKGSRLEGTLIKDMDFPEGARVILLYKNGDPIIPHGETKLSPGDRLIILSTESAMDKALSKMD